MSELELLKKRMEEQDKLIAGLKNDRAEMEAKLGGIHAAVSVKTDAEKAALRDLEERKAKVAAIQAEAKKLAGGADQVFYIVGPGGAYSGKKDYPPGSTIRCAADKIPSIEWTPAKPPNAVDSVPQASADDGEPASASAINKAEAAKPKTGIAAKPKTERPSDKEV